MAKRNKPISGSRAYRPLKRAKSEKPRINSWSDAESKVLGFTGYKAGMTHCIAVDETKTSSKSGSEVFVPVTIIECPPIRVVGIRLYKKNYEGTQAFSDIWCDDPGKDVQRRASTPKKPDSAKKLEQAQKELEKLSDIRLITHTKPAETHAPKKTPDVMELALSGSISEKLSYAREVLGKELSVGDVFREKTFIDVTSVTKGKGFGGVIKRYGLRKQPSKATKKRRHIGTGGSWKPQRKLWVEPLPGQIGYHTRTEYNKLIVKIGKDGNEVTPAGGFLRYGPVKNDYIMVYGSIPGPAKRVIRLTFPRRSHSEVNLEVKHIDTGSKQGA
jgi:large subunit ribosomal protein L3